MAARDLAIEKAGEAGLEPEGLEPQAADAMPQRGLAHRADGSPKASAQRNFTDSDSHIMKSDGNLLQGYNCQTLLWTVKPCVPLGRSVRRSRI